MEIREIKIPEIPQINVNTYISTPLPKLNVPLPSLDLPGCVKTHRDASIKNTQIIEDDVNGAFYSCPEGKIPSFVPINYDRKKIQIVEQKEEKPISTPNVPESTTPDIPDIPKEKKEIKLEPCPGNKDQRVGDFRNDKKLERVIGHERGQDESECITLYEAVEWKDQYIPSAPQFVGVFSLALVGASAPLVLQLVRPIVKQVVTKLTKKKKK